MAAAASPAAGSRASASVSTSSSPGDVDARGARALVVGRVIVDLTGTRFASSTAQPGNVLVFRREPTNAHDANAVKCESADGSRDYGHLTREHAKRFSPLLLALPQLELSVTLGADQSTRGVSFLARLEGVLKLAVALDDAAAASLTAALRATGYVRDVATTEAVAGFGARIRAREAAALRVKQGAAGAAGADAGAGEDADAAAGADVGAGASAGTGTGAGSDAARDGAHSARPASSADPVGVDADENAGAGAGTGATADQTTPTAALPVAAAANDDAGGAVPRVDDAAVAAPRAESPAAAPAATAGTKHARAADEDEPADAKRRAT